MNRNTVISISKGIAIILMVIAHAEAPAWLCKFIFEFHMPLFFITAGYFFSLKYLNDEATFVKKRIKGLYVPFVKWSVVFLALHNLMFEIGILNETYGN
jgi:fucose 4-O-acetylase-like acetyltransferase